MNEKSVELKEETLNITPDTETDNQSDTESTSENTAKNEALYEEAYEKLKEYGLAWTINSIRFMIEKHRVTFNQLRGCTFKVIDPETREKDVIYDLYKAVNLLIQAGLVGSEQYKDTELTKLKERAYEIMEDWRNTIGFIGVLHIFIINSMEKESFFMDTKANLILEQLNSKNSQTDLIKTIQASDLEMRYNQVNAILNS